MLVVTARDADEDRVQVHNLGADDYLISRLPWRSSRPASRDHCGVGRPYRRAVRLRSPLVLDLEARRTLQGELMRSTAMQWNLLEFLVFRAGQMSARITRGGVERVDSETVIPSIEVQLSRLRSKLEGAGIPKRSKRVRIFLEHSTNKTDSLRRLLFLWLACADRRANASPQWSLPIAVYFRAHAVTIMR